MEKLTNGLVFNGMAVRTTKSTPNFENQTFYVSSQTSDVYYVVRVRRVLLKILNRWLEPGSTQPTKDYEYICSCPDFIYREWPARKDCKHIEAVKTSARLVDSSYNLAQKLLKL